MAAMKLLVQPRDGVGPVLDAIKSAKTSIEIVIFRFNRDDIERALHAAVGRGVLVHALIANTNHGGAGRLRKLEQQLLGAGATVDRTGSDFIRYHGKFMIIDRTTLLVLGFNYTLLDITRSRSFGIITSNRKSVQEAVTLFAADCAQRPARSRRRAGGESGQRSRAAVRVHQQCEDTAACLRSQGQRPAHGQSAQRAGARGRGRRIIGKVGGRGHDLVHQKFHGHRLHVRSVMRDGTQAFIGSQSLRALELDKRREVGVFVTGATVVKEMIATFEADWAHTTLGQEAHAAAVQKRTGAATAAR